MYLWLNAPQLNLPPPLKKEEKTMLLALSPSHSL